MTSNLLDDLLTKESKGDDGFHMVVTRRARGGQYKGNRDALIHDLLRLGFYDLIEKAHDGSYD